MNCEAEEVDVFHRRFFATCERYDRARSTIRWKVADVRRGWECSSLGIGRRCGVGFSSRELERWRTSGKLLVGRGKRMRVAIRCGLMFVALSVAAGPAKADSPNDSWETILVRAQPVIQAQMNEVRELRKDTDAFVEQLNELVRSNKGKLKPELKGELARKRLYYYTRLGAVNAAVVEIEQALSAERCRRTPPRSHDRRCWICSPGCTVNLGPRW